MYKVVVGVSTFQDRPPVDNEPTDAGNDIHQQLDQPQGNEGGEGQNEHMGNNNVENNTQGNEGEEGQNEHMGNNNVENNTQGNEGGEGQNEHMGNNNVENNTQGNEGGEGQNEHMGNNNVENNTQGNEGEEGQNEHMGNNNVENNTQGNEGGEGQNEHMGNSNVESKTEVNDAGTIVHNNLQNNGATNIRGSEEGSEIGQKEKAKNVIDHVDNPEIVTHVELDNPENVNASHPDNATDPVLSDSNQIEDEEYIQRPQEQNDTILLLHIAPFPNTDTCSTITDSTCTCTCSSESDDDNIEVLQNPVKNEIKSEEVFDLNAVSPTKRMIGMEITDQPEAEIIHVLEDDIVKKDQATPLEKTSPEILASISNTLEAHEYMYMISATQVKEANINKPSWVVPGFMYHTKDLTTDLSEPDSFDINLSSGL